MTTGRPQPKKFAVTLEVANDVQARELNEAWQEIVSGQKLARTEALEESTEAILERARSALGIIETAIRANPTTGQTGRLVRFLAGVYNGQDYPFDLTDLRALDTRLANACLDYLNYDRLAKREVHHHLSGGEPELQQWMATAGLEPALHLDDAQAQAFARLPDQTGRERSELLREAIDDLFEKYRRKAYGSKP
jgi:Ribbon-helix-helix domain